MENNVKSIFQVKIVLQGNVESFEDYEKRINTELVKIQQQNKMTYSSDHAITLPSADQSGRLCCVINYKTEVKIKTKKK